MKLEYIEPFVTAVTTVLTAVLRSDVVRDDFVLLRGHELSGDIVVMIGLAEQQSESIILNMDAETANRIGAAMTDDACSGLDVDCMDALGELANMIAGNAVSALWDLGYTFTINPPAAVNRGDIPAVTAGLELFQVPVRTDFGGVTVNFTMKTA